jgi:hypothetical protein
VVKDRIIGTEMEYGIMASPVPGVEKLSLLEHVQLQAFVNQSLGNLGIAKLGGNNNYFLGNGGRLYQDINCLREFATPEDVSYEGVLASEIVGEKIVQTSASLYTSGTGSATFVTKRVIDDEDKTCGYHVSLSADAEKVSVTEQGLSLYGVFAATRAVLFGAGAIRSSGVYVIAQKASQLDSDYSQETTRNKPVVNLRNEAHSNDKYVRVHDTSGDPTMSPWATMVKFGAASIVLRLIENGRQIPELRFADNLHTVARQVAHDHELKNQYKIVDGEPMTALEVTRRIIREARDLEKEGGLSIQEQWALEEWEKAAADIGQDPALVMKKVEWVVRRMALLRQQSKHGWEWNSAPLRSKDRQFSDLSRRGVGVRLRKDAWSEYMPDTELLQSRLKTAPTTTRALLRGAFVKYFHARRSISACVDWAYAKPHENRRILMKDPFATTNPEIERILARGEAA